MAQAPPAPAPPLPQQQRQQQQGGLQLLQAFVARNHNVVPRELAVLRCCCKDLRRCVDGALPGLLRAHRLPSTLSLARFHVAHTFQRVARGCAELAPLVGELVAEEGGVVQAPTPAPAPVPAPPKPLQGPMDRALGLLEPGSRFQGSIRIPGMDSGRPEPYALLVLGQCGAVWEDANRGGLLVLHSAYGDAQACAMFVSAHTQPQAEGGGTVAASAAAGVRVQFSDAETVCDGVLDVDAQVIRGTVSQLRQGQPGFFFRSDRASHTFTLHRVREPAATTAARHTALQQRMAFGSELAALARVDLGSLQGLSTTVPWQVLLKDALVRMEMLCARLRYRATSLGLLQFTDAPHKHAVLNALAVLGFNRAGAHALQQRMHGEVLGLLSVCARSGHADAFTDQALMAMDLRLSNAYQVFDLALRECENRQPASVLEAMEAIQGGDVLCSICMLDIGANEQGVRMPCSHCFHRECVAEWFSSNNSCPYCRQQVSSC